MAAYFAAQNRNKSSVTLNYTKPEGQDVIKRLLKSSDVLVENFKAGTLVKYGLSRWAEPVYCAHKWCYKPNSHCYIIATHMISLAWSLSALVLVFLA